MGEQQWSRRRVLRSLAAAGAGAVVLPRSLGWREAAHADEAGPLGVVFDAAPFRLGVSSGYPRPDSVILWTRVAPRPLEPDGGQQDPVTVNWAVAANPDMSGVVASGSLTAEPAWGHSVHVDVTGLDPATTYYYRFSAPALDGVPSRVGRTKTAPDGPVDRVRFAVANCQNFAHGYFPALQHIAEEDLDFVLHLGDYIYEGRTGFRSFDVPAPLTLEAFRMCYAVYLGDPQLRAAHAAHPWILTWDDHEIINNYQGVHWPSNVMQRRTAGYQAYYEHLPIRLTEEGPPHDGFFRIYQDVKFGDLLDVVLMDTRQYRDPVVTVDNFSLDHNQHRPDRTLLGDTQLKWVQDTLSNSTSSWRVLGNSVHFMQWVPLENEDAWDGYTAERQALLKHIVDDQVPDVVSLAGDQHRHMWRHVTYDMVTAAVNEVTPVPAYDQKSPASVVLPEFGIIALATNVGGDGDNATERPAVYATDPHMRYFDRENWGYAVCDVTEDRWRTTARAIRHSTDPSGDPRRDQDATIQDLVTFEVERGSPLMHHVSGDGANPIPTPPTVPPDTL